MNRAEIEAKRDELGSLLVDASLVLDLSKPKHVTFPQEERNAVLERLAAFQAFLAEIANQVEQAYSPRREFAVGQHVRIIRNETWQGRICTVLHRSEEEPDMYYLHPHGWRRNDEIEAVKQVGRKHTYTARAFDRRHTYVTHKAKIEGREAVRAFKREARQKHKNIHHWRVYNETLQLTVEK